MSGSENHHGQLGRISLGICGVSILVVVTQLLTTPVLLGVALVGAGCVSAGLNWRRDGPLALGAGSIVGAIVLAGIGSRSTVWMLVVAVPALLAWTSATEAVRVARQLPGASTVRVELVRTVATATALVVGSSVIYILSTTVTGSDSPLSLALLLVAVVAFTIALRR